MITVSVLFAIAWLFAALETPMDCAQRSIVNWIRASLFRSLIISSAALSEVKVQIEKLKLRAPGAIAQ
jgi:hypothetical protein